MAKAKDRYLRCLVGIACCLWLTNVVAALRLDCYQTNDKALSVHAGGTFVDPYFANRALLIADQIGIEITPVAQDWIAWLIPRQLPDGRFERFCLRDQAWFACAGADADDAMLALWMELLYRVSSQKTRTGIWQDSMQRAQTQLEKLFDRKRGIYFVSQTQRYGLFMDNVEIYAALKSMAREQQKLGASLQAQATSKQADGLQRAINRTFWRNDWQAYVAATNEEEHQSFYPFTVAQVYPWLFDMPTPLSTQQAYQRWRAQYAEAWLGFTQDKYPWGLIAAMADKLGDSSLAIRWLKRSAHLRQTQRWNILEEAIYQALAEKYAIPYKLDCTGSPS